MAEEIVSLHAIAKTFYRGREPIPVLEKLDLEVPAGSVEALMGPSGSGKSTLLNIIGGLDKPDSGEVEVLRAGAGLSTERDSARAAADATAAALESAGLGRADVLLLFATTHHGPGFTRATRTGGNLAGTDNVIGCSAAGWCARHCRRPPARLETCTRSGT